MLTYLGFQNMDMECIHRVIILLERACVHNRIRRNWCKFSRPEFAMFANSQWRFAMTNSQWHLQWRHSVTSFETARSLAPGIAASPISLLSMVALEESVRLWAELNGGENYSLHWKPKMLPLFIIMTLWMYYNSMFRLQKVLQVKLFHRYYLLTSYFLVLIKTEIYVCGRNISYM